MPIKLGEYRLSEIHLKNQSWIWRDLSDVDQTFNQQANEQITAPPKLILIDLAYKLWTYLAWNWLESAVVSMWVNCRLQGPVDDKMC